MERNFACVDPWTDIFQVTSIGLDISCDKGVWDFFNDEVDLNEKFHDGDLLISNQQFNIRILYTK